MSEASPKLCELVAFRRDAVPELRLEETPTDEVFLEARVSRSGYRLMYVPEAIVHLQTPQSLGDFVKRRRSIHCGHLTIAKDFGYIVPTMRAFRVASALLRRARVFLASQTFSSHLKYSVPRDSFACSRSSRLHAGS
jgi:cellulose synthase/poly-beta-1,6-N-acetylglucosamine synthase-like glycosyltransferase